MYKIRTLIIINLSPIKRNGNIIIVYMGGMGNGSTMRQYISYSQTSREPMIQLEGKYCTVLWIPMK
jgi:hypothetical protein